MPRFTAVCSSTQSAAFSFITTVSKEHLRHKVDGLRLQQISKRTLRCSRVLLYPRGPRILGPYLHGETADSPHPPRGPRGVPRAPRRPRTRADLYLRHVLHKSA